MSTERDRMHKERTTKNPTLATDSDPGLDPSDPLMARIGAAFEADAQTIERVKIRARAAMRSEMRTESAPGRGPVRWVFRSALATALTLLVAVGAWELALVDNPENTPTALPVMLEEPPTKIVISNESGFVTVQTGGSQWIVLPGDKS